MAKWNLLKWMLLVFALSLALGEYWESEGRARWSQLKFYPTWEQEYTAKNGWETRPLLCAIDHGGERRTMICVPWFTPSKKR